MDVTGNYAVEQFYGSRAGWVACRAGLSRKLSTPRSQSPSLLWYIMVTLNSETSLFRIVREYFGRLLDQPHHSTVQGVYAALCPLTGVCESSGWLLTQSLRRVRRGLIASVRAPALDLAPSPNNESIIGPASKRQSPCISSWFFIRYNSFIQRQSWTTNENLPSFV